MLIPLPLIPYWTSVGTNVPLACATKTQQMLTKKQSNALITLTPSLREPLREIRRLYLTTLVLR